MEAIVKPRTDWEKAEYTPKLKADADVQKILDAFTSAILRFNAGQKLIAIQKLANEQLRTGEVEQVCIEQDNKIFVGTKGDFPSANMLLLADGQPFEKDQTYHKDTSFCVIHCRWVEYSLKHVLPMQEAFYQAVRRTLTALLEQGLRQRRI